MDNNYQLSYRDLQETLTNINDNDNEKAFISIAVRRNLVNHTITYRIINNKNDERIQRDYIFYKSAQVITYVPQVHVKIKVIWFACALFPPRALYTVNCTNKMHSRKPSFVMTPAGFSWHCKSLFSIYAPIF